MMRFFILFFPAKCGQECGQITGIFILLKHDFNGGKRKSVYGKTEQEAKKKRREWKKNVNSSAVLGNDRITVGQPMKRYQKILVRRNRTQVQGKTGPGARQSRAGRKAKQGRVQGETGPGYKAKQDRMQTPGLQAKIPFDGKQPKMPLKAFSPYLGLLSLCCSIQSLKRGFCPVYGEAEGIVTYPYQKRQQKSALPALTGRFSVEQRGS
jgi:hypothetical protein